jgi:hypothetical protein
MSEMQTATFRDRAGWAQGPWDTEPDRAEWRMPELPGYACLILRNHMGALCGYVGVPPGHPVHGTELDAIDGQVEVHGGVTFSSACSEGDGPGSETEMVGSPCGHCGRVNDLASGDKGDSPGPGAFCVCALCGGINQYGEDLRLVKFTDEQLGTLPADWRGELLEMQALMRAARMGTSPAKGKAEA